jgi:uncharacterized protein
MEIRIETGEGLNLVQRYAVGAVRIGSTEYESSILVMPGVPVVAWPPHSFDEIEAAHFELLAARKPQVVVLGTGRRQRFPAPQLLALLARERIGLEIMDTASACRTYNILAAEGRNVCAALLMIEAR